MIARSCLATLFCVALVTGCSTVPARNPVPRALVDEAEIPDLPQARFWGDELPENIDEILETARNRVEASAAQLGDGPTAFLALSGGGANGAFGAGLLAGWTASGTRPMFSMVTGTSTGALIAPFAYLGPDFDDELREVYTTIATADVIEQRGLLAGLTGDSFASTEPLRKLIARYIDEAVMSAIALEYLKGRGLLIGTTNLDSGRPVTWSIGAIAASGHPDSLELIREILRASAAIPGAFPPVYFDVEARGERYDEMHVDGGTASQVFLYPPSLDFRSVLDDVGLEGEAEMYVIRNGRLEPTWREVRPRLAAIAGQSISTLITTQGVGDLYRIYLGAQRDGLDYNLAYIPDSFTREPEEPFDKAYMNELFELGYEMAKNGYPWEKAPPSFAPPGRKR